MDFFPRDSRTSSKQRGKRAIGVRDTEVLLSQFLRVFLPKLKAHKRFSANLKVLKVKVDVKY